MAWDGPCGHPRSKSRVAPQGGPRGHPRWLGVAYAAQDPDLGWTTRPPHVADGGGLRRRCWRSMKASAGLNVCEGNYLVFCSHIFFLQFSFNDDVLNSEWIAQNPYYVQ
jgi:hypothetical protein